MRRTSYRLVKGLCGLGLVLILILGYQLLQDSTALPEVTITPTIEVSNATTTPVSSQVTIGNSVSLRPIVAYQLGTGEAELLFVGGMHGGYEWNSVLLAYTMIDYLTEHPELIPASMRITIIPDLNPDGTFAVTGTEGRFNLNDVHTTNTPGGGRFNANRVDLNRNFDCKWQATSTWRGQSVNAGTGAFSEKEAAALRDYVITNKPVGVIFWHSQANAVYASECLAGILPGTRTLMTIYATAANYHAIESFDAYPVTGDAEGWLASIGIPAITVELSSHTSLDWEKNRAGVVAVLNGFAPPAIE